MKILLKFLLILSSLFSISLSKVTPKEQLDIDIFNKNKESVVFISTSKKIVDYRSFTKYIVPRGTGSGFIWDKEGHIVTNYHVIDGANSAKVKLHNGKVYNAFLVGSYPRRDIAVLKISAKESNLKPIVVGKSSDLKVGQSVYAIGNPFGLDWTMTKGIVSALNRRVPSRDGTVLSRAIQTDAAINPGNSGGVMLNSSGELIGVNSAIYSPVRGSVGIGFAIPIDLVKPVVEKLIKFGKYIKPSIGIETDDSINRYMHKYLHKRGVAVLGVIKSSDAEAKGLIPAKYYMDGTIDFGDIIVALDGKKVNSISDLDDILDSHKIGDSVTLTIKRGKKHQDIDITLIGLDS